MSVSKWPPFFCFAAYRVHAGSESHDSGVSGDGVHWILREAHSHSNQQYHHGRVILGVKDRDIPTDSTSSSWSYEYYAVLGE